MASENYPAVFAARTNRSGCWRHQPRSVGVARALALHVASGKPCSILLSRGLVAGHVF